MADKVVVIYELYDEEVAVYGGTDNEEQLQALYAEIEDAGWSIKHDSFSKGTVYVYVERRESWA